MLSYKSIFHSALFPAKRLYPAGDLQLFPITHIAELSGYLFLACSISSTTTETGHPFAVPLIASNQCVCVHKLLASSEDS